MRDDHMNLSFFWGLLPIPALIFVLRAVDLALATLRTLTVLRGQRIRTWILGFAQAFLFVTAVAGVLTYLDNAVNLLAYAGGFATGSVIGITIERWLAPGHSQVTVISQGRGSEVADTLRDVGRGATELPARGQEGTVSMILCNVPRKEIGEVKQLIISTDPLSFIAVEHVRLFRGGWRA
jgi:uncharacterized protein YebE (UPF0316 family)